MRLVLLLLCIPFALLLEGFRRKLIARMQSRVGPPVWQVFLDLRKLLSKRTLIARESHNLLFEFMPFAGLITAVILILLISGIVSFNYDFLVIAYLFVALDAFLIVGGVASKSPFALQSSSRDLLLMIGYESAFILSIITFFSVSGSSSLLVYSPVFLPLASIIIIIAGMPMVGITPFDTVRAGTELAGCVKSEYSGPGLFAFELGEFVRDFAYYWLVSVLLAGWSWFALIVFAVLFFGFCLSQASTPRLSALNTAKVLLGLGVLAFINLFMLV